MPKPTNKKELLLRAAEHFEKLHALVDGLSAAQQKAEFPKGTLNRNLRDVLCHLHHWHLLLLGWYEIGMAGDKPDMPAKGYTWTTLPALNQWINKKYSKTSLKKSKELLQQSHEEVVALIRSHSNAELFTKKKYGWTGSTSMGAYCTSAVISHYDWAYKLLRKATK